MAGTVYNPLAASNPDGSTFVNDAVGKAGEQLVAEIHGQYYTTNYRGGLFTFGVAGVTLPVNAATLSSVFSLYNPPGSGKEIELVDMDWALVLATTVVNGYGIYIQTPANAAKATFTTAGTPTSLNIGGFGSSPAAIPYTALTASGTPTLAVLFGNTGAVTSTNSGVYNYKFNGKLILSPGAILHVATTTAATTASGFTGQLTWAEYPV